MKRGLPPVYPGEILLEDFLKPMKITQYRLAKSIGVQQRRIGEIIAGKKSDYSGYGPAVGPFFRHGRSKLDESANPLRPRCCGRITFRPVRAGGYNIRRISCRLRKSL